MKKIIEMALPLKNINEASINEKLYNGHPGNMHLWWNRSPIKSSKSLLMATMLDTSIKKTDTINLDVVEIKKSGFPTVVDPFSGFGGLSIAAQSLGLNVQSSDLNSVAVILTKAVTEIPKRFWKKPAVNGLANSMFYDQLQGIQEDITQYGKLLKSKAQQDMKDYYGDAENVYSWIWTRTVKCPNPACDCEMPLASSYVLSKAKEREYWIEPYCEDKKLHFAIRKGKCPDDKQGNKVVSTGAKFKCPVCGSLTTDAYIKQQGLIGRIENKLMAICVIENGERVYLEPENLGALQVDCEEEMDGLAGSISNNTRWFSPPLYGMKEYSELYLPRQIKLLSVLCKLLSEIQPIIETDAIRAGLVDDEIPLKDGGNGALAYAQAVTVYLSLVISKLSNYQSTICTWDNRKGNIRATFTRQAIPMTYVFAEGNPFSKVTGNFDTMIKNVVDSLAELTLEGEAKVSQADAITIEYPEKSILFTELPYLDNVGYADLSDYFYLWMRKGLKDIYPDVFEKIVSSKEELTSIPEHFGGDGKEAYIAYSNGIEKLFKNFSKKASEEYPSTVFFELNKSDWTSISSQSLIEETCLEMILSKIVLAGFRIMSIWPIRTQKPSEKFESYRVAIVFRKEDCKENRTTRRGFINLLKRELPELLEQAYSQEVSDFDKPTVGIGKGLEVFTAYSQILNADGSNMNMHDALQLIYQEVMDYLNQLNAVENANVTAIKEG